MTANAVGRSRVRATIALIACGLISTAHVGSPNTFFAGDAGPYPIRVTVRLPGVIPGRAQISVRVTGAAPDTIRTVTVRTALWTVGIEGAPPAETAARVPGDPELYATELWFMAPSSYRLFVTVDGLRGTGTAIVPAVALATAERTMGRGLGVLLALLGLFLAVGMLTIVGCAIRESGLAPGAEVDTIHRRRGRRAMAIAALLLLAVGWGGRRWWSAEAASYGRFVLYRPLASEAATHLEAGHQILTLTIRDERWPERPNPNARYNALIPDHGKLMHMFLIRGPALDAFAHVHPVPRGPSAHVFDVPLPALPEGRYRVYGDIVHESGYAQTLVTTTDVAATATPPRAADADDSWFEGQAISESDAPLFRLADGSAIVWQRGPGPLVAEQERLLTFSAQDPAGAPLALESYMGMAGHVVVAREDGSVFVHLHPSGSISMAALQRFTRADGGYGAKPHAMETMVEQPVHAISIPYAFPKPGMYRIFVQVKHGGRILTSAFTANVADR
jgi:hypothetical protein